MTLDKKYTLKKKPAIFFFTLLLAPFMLSVLQVATDFVFGGESNKDILFVASMLAIGSLGSKGKRDD